MVMIHGDWNTGRTFGFDEDATLLLLWKEADRGACGIRSHAVAMHGFRLKGVTGLWGDGLDSGGNFVSLSPSATSW